MGEIVGVGVGVGVPSASRVKVENNVDAIKRGIFHFGGVVAGFHTNISWSRTKTGKVKLMHPSKRSTGHAVFLMGWEEDDYIIFKNSWGFKWGEHGYGRVSPDYVDSELISAYTAVDE